MNRWIFKAIELLHRGYLFSDLSEEEKRQIIAVAKGLEAAYNEGLSEKSKRS